MEGRRGQGGRELFLVLGSRLGPGACLGLATHACPSASVGFLARFLFLSLGGVFLRK